MAVFIRIRLSGHRFPGARRGGAKEKTAGTENTADVAEAISRDGLRREKMPKRRTFNIAMTVANPSRTLRPEADVPETPGVRNGETGSAVCGKRSADKTGRWRRPRRKAIGSENRRNGLRRRRKAAMNPWPDFEKKRPRRRGNSVAGVGEARRKKISGRTSPRRRRRCTWLRRGPPRRKRRRSPGPFPNRRIR